MPHAAMLKKHPWIWIVVAFAVLVTAWVFFIRIAVENQPENLPLVNERRDGNARH